jgi:hypothetical protein
MGCCGKLRSALSDPAGHAVPPAQRLPLGVRPNIARARTVPPVVASVPVRYVELPSIVVHGPVSGRKYAFSGTNPVQSVDGRDAGAFLQTRFFRRA